MSPSLTRLRLQIHGRVQGVWFRDSVRRTATEHGVSGWAENRRDGSVEALTRRGVSFLVCNNALTATPVVTPATAPQRFLYVRANDGYPRTRSHSGRTE